MAVVLTFGGGAAGGEGRPHGRPVRQAALAPTSRRSTASSCRPIAATSSTASSSRRTRACPIRERPAAGLQPVGRDAEPAARLRPGRLRRPAQGPSLEPGLRRATARRRERYQELADAHRRDAGLHGRLRHRPRQTTPQIARDRVLHQPRGAAAALRAGADPRRFAPPATGTTARPTCCGSATAPASSTAPMSSSCAACKNPIGLKCGPTPRARRAAAPDRRAEPGERARPPDADRAASAPTRSPSKLPPLMRAVKREGRNGGLVVRPDARQHAQGRRTATRPAPSTASWRRCAASSPCTAPRAPIPAACISR